MTRPKQKQKPPQTDNFENTPYARRLFEGFTKSPAPTFSEKEAEDYFRNTYHDEGRAHTYVPLPSMVRAALPKSFFDIAPPTLADYQRVAWKKRNGASPGFNAISYVPYKKCPAILKVQVEIAKRIWKEPTVMANYSFQ